MQTFGEYLKSIRKDLGVTQIYLAKQMGISVTWLCDVESNRRCGFDADKCARITAVLRLTEAQNNMLLTLSGESKHEIPLDLTPYICKSPTLIEFLRAANAAGLKPADWRRLTAEIQDTNHTGDDQK